MAPLYIFPDTSVLMHFPRIDELDWKALGGKKAIVIVLAPAVLKELGKHKDQHPNRKLRQRARNLNTWLRELRKLDDKRLKNGVTLEVATKEPTRFLTGDLDPAVSDDRIIASALAYAAEGRSVAIATDDTIFLHKLDTHGIQAIEVPEDKRLADEPDEIEAEARSLRKQLADVKSRQPSLDLAWQITDGRSAEIIVVPANLNAIASPDEMARLHPRKRKRGEKSDSPFGAFADASLYMGITDEMIDRYNGKLSIFMRHYESYYEKVQAIAGLRRRYIALPLRLKNVGHASATHIQASVKFPEGMALMKKEPSFKFPEAPEPPELPSPFGLERPFAFTADIFRRANLDTSIFDPSMIYDPFRPVIDEDAGTARWKRDRLLHGTAEELDPLHCTMGDHLIGTTVSIEVELHAEELATAERFQLEVRIVENSGD